MGFEEPEQFAPAPEVPAAPTRCRCQLFPEEVVACIADGREPTTSELMSVAGRISAEARAGSVSSWTLYAAHLALTGDCSLAKCLIEVRDIHAERDHAIRESITSRLIVR